MSRPTSTPKTNIYLILALMTFALLLVAMGVGALSIANVNKTSNLSTFSNKGPVPQNFLIVLIDDVGVDQIAAYNEGANPAKTPVINQLAAEGVLFRNAYSNPLCTPTRAGLQSGRHAFRTGVGNNINFDGSGHTLLRSELILPEMLKLGTNNTYTTALFGKWHLANQVNGGFLSPNVMGYDYYAGHMGNLLELQNESYFKWKKTVNGVTNQKTGYITSDEIDDAISWTSQQTKPWLAVITFHAPHSPYHVPPANLHTTPTGTNLLKYQAALEAMDTELGRLLTQLKQNGQYNNTTIIVMGDNGTPGGIVSYPAKGTLYEGGINVPFIVRSPLVKVPGSESAAFVQTTDMLATLADIAQVDLSSVGAGIKMDSVSIVPYLKNPSTRSIRAYGFSEHFAPLGPGHGSLTPPPIVSLSKKIIRDAQYKLHLDIITQQEEFYDLLADPAESRNLLISGLTPGSPEEAAYANLKAQLIALVNS